MLNRRSFLKTGVISTLAATSQAHAFTPAPQKWDAEYDIIIIGAGDGGLAAGCLAMQKGLKTLILEKTAIVGGSSLLCGGKWAVTDTVDQHERGIVDSDERKRKNTTTSFVLKEASNPRKSLMAEARLFRELIIFLLLFWSAT